MFHLILDKNNGLTSTEYSSDTDKTFTFNKQFISSSVHQQKLKIKKIKAINFFTREVYKTIDMLD